MPTSSPTSRGDSRWAPRQLVNKIKRKRSGVDAAYRSRSKGQREFRTLDSFPGETDDEKFDAAMAYVKTTLDHGVTLTFDRDLEITKPLTIPGNVTHFVLAGGGHTITYTGETGSGLQEVEFDEHGRLWVPRVPRPQVESRGVIHIDGSDSGWRPPVPPVKPAKPVEHVWIDGVKQPDGTKLERS